MLINLRSNALAALLMCAASVSAQILVGQTAGYSGPVASGVKETSDGAKLYINAVNAKGGVNGQKIELLALDDKFEPKLAAENARILIEEKNVVSMFLTRGTPHTEAILPFLDKMHRFIRLWRRLGWTIEELDTVLTALKAPNFTPSVIQQISAFKTIKNRTQLPIDQLASLFGDIETQGEKPLFTKLFQSRAIQQIDTVFMPDAFGTLFTQSTTILDHKNAILAAFKLKNEELTAILDNAGLPPDLTLSTLSFIYRYTILAKALKLKIEDFIALKRLTGFLPFSDLRLGVFEDIDPQRTINCLKSVIKYN